MSNRRFQPYPPTELDDPNTDEFIRANIEAALVSVRDIINNANDLNSTSQQYQSIKSSDRDDYLLALVLNLKQSFRNINTIYNDISNIGSTSTSISISGFDTTIIDDISENVNEISDNLIELSNKFDKFEDYFTKKPYLLISPSYENPLPGNNNTIRLSWSLPEPKPKKAALNFIGSNHDIEGIDINLSLIDSNIKSLLDNANINLTNYNYLPYFDSVNIDYRKKSDSRDNWITISTNEIRLNGINNPSPELYPHTERVEIKLGTADKIGSYDYSNNKLIYKNENLFPINTEQYQFRIYLKNQNDNTVSPPGYTDTYGVQDPSWRYLYIPDNSNEWIILPQRGAATAPLLIELIDQTYRTLNITGANNNPNSTNPQAEVGLNTLFNDLASNNLYVNYGFDLSGSRSNSSKQAIPVNSSYANIFQSYQSNNLTINDWSINNNFSPDTSINPTQTSNNIIFPGYIYEISGYYMKINTDESSNVYSSHYPTNTPYPYIITPNPSRSNVTDGTSNYDNFVSSATSFYQIKSGSGYIISSAYSKNSSSIISDIHFVDPGDTFQLSSNTTYKIKCARDINDTLFGTDLSGQYICYFQFSTNAAIPTTLTGATRQGFTGNDSPGTQSNNFFEFDESETKDAANTSSDSEENYRRQGWYLGVDLQNLKVKNIKLENYPDICNNSYNPWDILFKQFNNDHQLLGTSSYELYIAQKPTQDISLINYTISHNVSTSLTYQDFFGLKHIYNNINITTSGEFINLNPDWRTNLNITETPFTLKINNSTIDSQNIDWPTGGQTNKNFTEILRIEISDFTNSSRYYSRELSNHFTINGSHRNNITKTPETYTINSQNINFDGKNLLWDYTWNHSNGIKNLLPNTSWMSGIELMNVGPGLYPDTSNNFSSFNTLINHNDSILNNQLMWANNGYKSGNYTISSDDNPYIDYSVYYNNNLDYSQFNNSGTIVNANDFKYSPSPGSKLINDLSATVLAGTYKWIVFKAVRYNANGNIKVNVYSSSNSSSILTLGQDYLLFIMEDNSGLGIGTMRTGWKSCQLQFNSGLSASLNNKNGAGAYNTSNNNYPIQIFSSTSNISIYYRIGLKNNSNINIHHITIDYQ